MPLTIHHLQQSNSERVLWLCEELGIPYELKIYTRDPATMLAPPELKALHFSAGAPIIQDTTDAGTITIAECSAILDYIAHRYGSGRLFLPPTHPDYSSFVYWFHAAGGSLLPAIGRGMLVRSAKLSEQEGPGKILATLANDKIRNMLRALDARVAETGKWIAGEEFSAADIMAVFPITTMRFFNPLDLTEFPALVAYLGRIGEREAYKRAMEKGDPGMEPVLSAAPPEPFPALRGR